MAGINPQTGQFDLNYTGPDFSSLSSYGYTSPGMSSVPGAPTTSSSLPTSIPNWGASTSTSTPGAVPTAAMPQFGWNLDTLKTGLGVAQTGANIYSAFEQASLAKQQLDYAKQIGNANLANQMASYNTNLTAQANMNAKVGGWTPEQTAAYLAANKLTGK